MHQSPRTDLQKSETEDRVTIDYKNRYTLLEGQEGQEIVKIVEKSQKIET